jgi:hypothetical protein
VVVSSPFYVCILNSFILFCVEKIEIGDGVKSGCGDCSRHRSERLPLHTLGQSIMSAAAAPAAAPAAADAKETTIALALLAAAKEIDPKNADNLSQMKADLKLGVLIRRILQVCNQAKESFWLPDGSRAGDWGTHFEKVFVDAGFGEWKMLGRELIEFNYDGKLYKEESDSDEEEEEEDEVHPECGFTDRQLAILFPKATMFSGLIDLLRTEDDVCENDAGSEDHHKDTVVAALEPEAMSVLYEVFSGLDDAHIQGIAKRVAIIRTKIDSSD